MKTLGIRKETKNKWEKRVPLNPEAVASLVRQGFRIIIQPSEIRIYADEEYRSAGAILAEDLSSCDLILGVKEVPVEQIVPGVPHLFFSHTIKGQDFNMPLLQKFLKSRTTLLDYELIADDQGKRLVFFGQYAGNAGMIDTLWGAGRRLQLQFGVETPFLNVKRAFEYESVQDAVDHFRQVGREIKDKGLPAELAPFNIFLLGYGHVATGCREILDALPCEEISPDDLFAHSKNFRNDRLYLVVFQEKHLVERKDGGAFELQDYYQNGNDYKSRLGKYLHLCSIYVNAIYWAPGYPVFLPRSELKLLQTDPQKLVIIGDITCDINGSVAATLKASNPDEPVYIYDAMSGTVQNGFLGKGVANCAVDNFPCEFSREASNYFTRALLPFLPAMLNNDYALPCESWDLPGEIKRSCIAHQGSLIPRFNYLNKYLKNS